MNRQTEAILSIIAALFVLFTAMLDPRISVGLAVVLLVMVGIYQLVQSRRHA